MDFARQSAYDIRLKMAERGWHSDDRITQSTMTAHQN